VDHQVQREVERGDGSDDAQWFALGETVVFGEAFLGVHGDVFAEHTFGLFRREVECLDGTVDFAAGFREWLALFASEDAGDVIQSIFDLTVGRREELVTLVGREIRGFESGVGRIGGRFTLEEVSQLKNVIVDLDNVAGGPGA
jgi:hypothetical protein